MVSGGNGSLGDIGASTAMPRGREVGILQYNDNKRFGLVTQKTNSFLLGYYSLFLRGEMFFYRFVISCPDKKTSLLHRNL